MKKEKAEKEKKEKEEKEKKRKEEKERKRKEKEKAEKERKEKENEERDNNKTLPNKNERNDFDKNYSYLNLKTEGNVKSKLKNDKKSFISHLQKIKDFPVKIVPTEANEKDKTNTQRDKAVTPNKKMNKNDDLQLYESFMQNNKKTEKGGKQKSYQKQNLKTGSKYQKSSESNKTTIECRPKSKSGSKKLKSIRTIQNYHTLQNEDISDKKNRSKNICLTIEKTNPEKYGNLLLKNKSEFISNFSDNKYDNHFKKQNSELTVGLGDDIKNKETGIEDNEDKNLEFNLRKNKKLSYSKGKYKKHKNKNYLYYDPLNPYLANWANSFLKIGYNVGLHSNQNIDGVPILRIQKLKPKVVLPPIYKVKYNQFSETKNILNNNDDDANLVCSKIAHKLFSPSTTNYNIPRNKSKNSFLTQFNQKENTENKNDEEEQKFEVSNQINAENKLESDIINKEEDKIEIKNSNVYNIKLEKENE